MDNDFLRRFLSVAITTALMWYPCMLGSVIVIMPLLKIYRAITKKELPDEIWMVILYVITLCFLGVLWRLWFYEYPTQVNIVAVIAILVAICLYAYQFRSEEKSKEVIEPPSSTRANRTDNNRNIGNFPLVSSTKVDSHPSINVEARAFSDNNTFPQSRADESLCSYQVKRTFYTKRGDIVYSAAEAVIADLLFQANLEYAYLQPVELPNYHFWPNFTITISNYGKRIFWLHRDPDDGENFGCKWSKEDSIFAQNNIVEGENLVITTKNDSALFASIISHLKKPLHHAFQGNENVYSNRSLSKQELVCDGCAFTNHFFEDIHSCKECIIIYSPFMTEKRINQLEPTFRDAIFRGKKIVVVTKDLSTRKEEYQKYLKCERILSSIGIHIIHRGDMHEKFVFVDKEVLWNGSLNVLSYSGHTSETMERRTDKATIAIYEKLLGVASIRNEILTDYFLLS